MHDGKQYILVAVSQSGANAGAQLIAYALPWGRRVTLKPTLQIFSSTSKRKVASPHTLHLMQTQQVESVAREQQKNMSP